MVSYMDAISKLVAQILNGLGPPLSFFHNKTRIVNKAIQYRVAMLKS